MIHGALICCLAYFICNTLSWLTNLDVWQRPLIVAPLTGLLLGDVQTGIIMGASLEGIFMGISAIGGSVPANATLGAVIAVAYTLLSGADVETGLAIAMPIATLSNSLGSFFTPLFAATAPYWERLAGTGDMKKFTTQNVWFTVIFYNITALIVIFLSVAYGTTALQSFLDAVPAFVTRGLNAASGIMIGVGYAILLSMIWNKEIAYFFLVGYVLNVYLNVPILGVAIVGFICAMSAFALEKVKIGSVKKAPAVEEKKTEDSGEEDFFND